MINQGLSQVVTQIAYVWRGKGRTRTEDMWDDKVQSRCGTRVNDLGTTDSGSQGPNVMTIRWDAYANAQGHAICDHNGDNKGDALVGTLVDTLVVVPN